MDIDLAAFNLALDRAENDTAEKFNGQTCSMTDRDGNDTCPICYFRRVLKFYLGLIDDPEKHPVQFQD